MANPTWEDDGLGPPPPKFDELGPQTVAKPVRPNVVEFSKEDFEKVKAEDSERSREAFLRYLRDYLVGAGRSAAGAGSFGAAPKLTASLEAMKNAALGQKDWDEQYYKDSNELDAAYKKAESDHPPFALAGMMANPVSKIGGFSKAFGVASKLGKVGVGALEGITQANALTALSRAANDTATPAGLEYGLSSGIGGTLGAFSGAAGVATDALAARYAKAKAAQLAQSTAAIEKAIESQRGTYRSAVQSGSRALENIGRASEGQAVGDDMAYAAMEALESPNARQLGEQVAQNTMEQLPQRLSAIETEKAALQQMLADKEASIAAHAAGAGENVFKKEFLPRAGRYLTRSALPAVGGMVGYQMGGESTEGKLIGGAAGGLAGSIGAAALGQPGTAWANMMRKPAVQAWMASATQKPFRAAQTASQYASPVAAQSMGEKFSEYIMGNQPAQRGDEQEAQDAFRKNR